jgi:hypothetical protein
VKPTETQYERFARERKEAKDQESQKRQAELDKVREDALARPSKLLQPANPPEILMLPAGKPQQLTTIPDYSTLPPKEAALAAQQEFNRINDFYQGNIPE